jgi:excinuclease ABC subunit C
MEQALTAATAACSRARCRCRTCSSSTAARASSAPCEAVLEELGVTGLQLVGVAKGPDRKAGAEQLWLPERATPIIAGADSPALHLVQQIRDEAHRFAITGHRQRRDKARRTSVLEGIPGVGPKRRQSLLKAFGGLRGLTRAAPEDIARVDGISDELPAHPRCVRSDG